jgi:probable rRNA maturation factor
MGRRPLAESRPIYVGRWRIDITIRPGVIRLVPFTVLARAIGSALDAAGAPSPASIGLILAGDAELAGLNLSHMGKDGPTDVLSFPLLPPASFPAQPGGAPRPALSRIAFALPPGRRPHLGDIVVSIERATDQAQAGRGGQTGDIRWSAADELRLLVTHGALHVCGWDHAEPAAQAAMRALEQKLLARS